MSLNYPVVLLEIENKRERQKKIKKKTVEEEGCFFLSGVNACYYINIR